MAPAKCVTPDPPVSFDGHADEPRITSGPQTVNGTVLASASAMPRAQRSPFVWCLLALTLLCSVPADAQPAPAPACGERPTAQVTPLDAAAPPSARPDGENIVLTTTLSARPVEVRMDSFQFANAFSGNGAITAVDVLPVAQGSIVLVHHNLDMVVDPPRFSRSRWSELWWFPPSFQTGDCPESVRLPGSSLRGSLHWAASAASNGALCLSDADGATTRFAVEAESLVAQANAEPCRPRLARQRDLLWRVATNEDSLRGALESDVGGTADTWVALGDDYLSHDRVRSFRLGPQLEVFAIDAFWSDDGQYMPGEHVPEIRGTRLVVIDGRSGQVVVRYVYASIGRYCRARMRRREIQCGRRRIHITPSGAVELR